MHQYTLVDRPVVILSENRRNVIPHGRPLSPMGTVRSLSPFVPRQPSKSGRLNEVKHGDSISPSISLMDYQKSTQDNLMMISNNLSTMLKESFAGIDTICQKVRLCLLEANKPPSQPNLLVSVTQTETHPLLSVCEEEQNSEGTEGDVEDIDEDTTVDQIIEEQEPDEKRCEEEKEDKAKHTTPRIPSITPFFTILHPPTQSAESVGVRRSKLRLSRKCTAENFQKTMKEVERLSDYEQILTSMVDDINKEIEKCYSSYPKTKNDEGGKKETTTRWSDAAAALQKFQKLKLQKDLTEDLQLSDNDLGSKHSIGRVSRRNAICFHGTRMDYTSADVYRKRAITDLHKRLVAQVEANDSLVFFQKLMARNKKHLEADRGDISQPIFPVLPPRQETSEKKLRSVVDLSKKYQNSLWFRQHRKPQESTKSRKERNDRRKKKDKKQADKEQQPKCLPQSYTIQRDVTKHGLKQHSKCNCRITVTNDQPLSEPDRCKIHWMRTKYNLMASKKLKYLDILDDITKNDLLPIKAEYPRRDGYKTTNLKNSYLYKLIYGKNKDTQIAWTQLFECKKKAEAPSSDKEKNEENGLTGADVRRKLSKYIFADDSALDTTKQVYTVMPVHVFLDNQTRPALPIKKNEALPKLPLIPMKETKELVKKAEWGETIKKLKPMKIVYDPILRKIDKEIRLASPKQDYNKFKASSLGSTNSWSPKNFSKFCSPTPRQFSIKVDTLEKHRKIASSGTICHPTPPIAEIFKRSPKASSEKMSHPLVPPLWNSPTVENFLHKKDSDIKYKIQKTINAEAQARRRNEQQRKIWENKYGKSVGQKLLSFIEKQPPAYHTPLPKHVMPKPVKDSSRQHAMLEQLRSLKQKNDSIQTNIQRAIDVIENKMVDILSKTANSESIEAFDAMEKEITNVLSLMKTSNGIPEEEQQEKKVEEFGEEVDQISQELFKKLDRILECPKSTKNLVKKPDKTKKRSKFPEPSYPVRSCDMNKVCFSSTSASGEEKFTITAISPKKSKKDTNRADAPVTKKLQKEEKEPPAKKEEPRAVGRFFGRKIAPITDQVVNVVLVDNTIPAGSAGDQLEQEHNSKSTDLEEDKTFSMVPSLSQGDFEDKELVPQLPQDDVKQQGTKIMDEKVSQASLDHTEQTGPYFTPQMSPLCQTREQVVVVPIVEEEPQIIKEKEEPHILDKEEEELVPSEALMHECKVEEEIKEAVKEEEEEKTTTTNVDDFYDNVNKIISRVETVYNQLEEFEEEMLTEETRKIPVFKEAPVNAAPVETDTFLTPFMSAVKDLRRPDSRNSSPRLQRSPSFYNVLTFLDTLTDLKGDDRPVEVYTSRICETPLTLHTAVPIHNAFILHEAVLTSPNADLPKKKSGCLKKPSSHACVDSMMSKSKQKVSFLLDKEEKSTQATLCPLHGGGQKQSAQNSEETFHSIMKDEQVSAFLDVHEHKSIDKMSILDEDDTYQSTLEISDEASSEKNQQMPEQVVQSVQDTFKQSQEEENNKKNVVEIFRNVCSSDNSSKKVKVFYDDFKGKTNNINAKVLSGFYNEDSIVQVQQSLSKDLVAKKRASIEKLIDTKALLIELIKNQSLLEPIKNLNNFIDSELLKEVIEKRQKLRMMRRTSSHSLAASKRVLDAKEGEKEGLLKGIYVIVYLLMFTALNLEYKCL